MRSLKKNSWPGNKALFAAKIEKRQQPTYPKNGWNETLVDLRTHKHYRSQFGFFDAKRSKPIWSVLNHQRRVSIPKFERSQKCKKNSVSFMKFTLPQISFQHWEVGRNMCSNLEKSNHSENIRDYVDLSGIMCKKIYTVKTKKYLRISPGIKLVCQKS